MRIAVTSDIHFFPQWKNEIHALADLLRAHNPDLLILAGDIGEPLDMLVHGLEVFAPVCKQRLALAGNHDVWHRTGAYSSERLWTSLLAEAARSYGYIWLEQDSMVIHDLGICGTLAWYDYSGAHPNLRVDGHFYEYIKPKLSNDAVYIDWPWSDREFAQRIGQEFERRLDALQRNPQVRHILVATHVPLFMECLRPTDNIEQGMVNAYYVNASLGERVLTRSKVRAVVSGHVHIERQLFIPRHNGRGNGKNGSGGRGSEAEYKTASLPPPLAVYTVPSDYGSPAAVLLDTTTWQAEVIRVGDAKPLMRSA